MIIDSHTHLLLSSQKNDIEIAIKEAKENRVTKIFEIAVNLDYIKQARKLSKKYDEIYYSAGIHPCDAVEYGLDKLDEVMNNLENLIENSDKLIGIGECGLDFYWLSKDAKKAPQEVETQKAYFIAQIRLAKKLNIPLIIHDREAGFSVFEILKQEEYGNFVFHCYNENLGYAKNILSDFPKAMFSFAGNLTYKSAKNIQETAKNLPINKIMVETDAPYLTPQKFRGQENFPKNTLYTLEFLAELRGEDLDTLESQIYKNTTNFFNIK
ncbi:MAG: TatD family hydrolase [Candidatus Gracilibacteria bacterium]|nr:TatD family hydrolase [Candidatus Gracilibacteria bacterium]